MTAESHDPAGGAAQNLSHRLAAHGMSFDARALAPQTLHAAKRAVLDGIGVMLAASGTSTDILPFRELALVQSGAPQASVLGFGDRLSVDQAALVNGAMAHALDYEDAFDPVPLHPNASLLPAALACAEAFGCTGREFLAAVILGCDLVCRMGLALREPMERLGWYPPPILGAFGATLAAARIMRLSPRQLCDAWSLLLCQNSCAGEIKFSPDSTLRAVREAFPAHAAVLCVQLASRGVRGFDAPLEGRAGFYQLFAGGAYDADVLLEHLGETFWIEQLSFKCWPACRGTHAYIEAAQVLRSRAGVDPSLIESFICVGGQAQQMLAEPRASKQAPHTLIDAKFSLPFTVALALVHGEIGLNSFTERMLADRAVLALAARSDFRLEPDASWNEATRGKLIVRLRSGEALTHEVHAALGDPQRPLSDEALRGKFIECAAHAGRPFSSERAHRLAQRIFALENELEVASLLREA